MKLTPLDKFLLCEGKFLSFFKRDFLDGQGNKKVYEYVERNKKQKAAVIIAEKENSFLLIKQYRIPVLSYVIEFPAGLIEEDEKLEEAALRELLEETGYKGQILEVSPLTFTSAGLTTEEVYFVKVKILDFISSNCESSEDISILWVDEKRWQQIKKSGIPINGWVYSYLEGRFNKDSI